MPIQVMQQTPPSALRRSLEGDRWGLWRLSQYLAACDSASYPAASSKMLPGYLFTIDAKSDSPWLVSADEHCFSGSTPAQTGPVH